MPPAIAPAAEEMTKYVRITGARLGHYVEFEFWVNDRDLMVELILPFAAFKEFCDAQQARVLSPDPSVAETVEQHAWRARQPGLLRRIDDSGA
jgi:phenol hydroxylase P0 protein